MEALGGFLNWAWERHQNQLSWYIRPLFVLPFCYFAYRKSVWGMALTIVGVASSMFWFPAPATPDPRAAQFLAVERQYVGGPWTLGRIVITALIPIWFVALAWAVRRRSWVGAAAVIGSGTLLKIAWSFHAAGDGAWVIMPPVAFGAAVCAGVLWFAYARVRSRPA